MSDAVISAPALEFLVEDVRALEHAAVPTLAFRLRISSGDREIRSLSLNAQVRIDAPRRAYTEAERERLFELYGRAPEWRSTLRSLLWTQTSVTVPPFAGETVVELLVPCTYDFDVVATKYLHALEDGEVPLELLFSGTVFYADEGRLQVAHVPWDREARCLLPVRVWRDALEHAFPGSAWIRLGRDSFDRLQAYKSSRALLTWDATLDDLLRGRE